MSKRYNTPHRIHMVKTRMTDEEYELFQARLSAYDISQAEFIRQAINKAEIHPIVTVSPINDQVLGAIGRLIGEFGKIGSNLNQIARSLNEWHSPYPGLAKEIRAAITELTELKFTVLKKMGDMLGNVQTYKL